MERFIRELRPAIETALERFAEEWEGDAREQRTWLDDSGSAAAALTGWVVGRGDSGKNLSNPTWVTARTPRFRSKRHKNWWWNFFPAEINEEAIQGPDENDIVVALSHGIQYGLDLEEAAHGHLLNEMLHSHVDEFIRTVESAIAGI